MNDAEAKHGCPVCDAPLTPSDTMWCNECRILYPWPLLKATMNNWTFYAKLTTGELISFHEAHIKGDWVTLVDPTLISPRTADDRVSVLMLGRGMVVQVNRIVWCSDEDS